MPSFGRDSPTSTSSMSNYPPGKLPPPFGIGANQMPGSGASSSSLSSASVGGSNFSTAGSGVGGPAAAAAAAVLEAVSSGARYPNSAQVPGQQPYMSTPEMMLGKGSENVPSSRMSPMQLESMMGNVQSGVGYFLNFFSFNSLITDILAFHSNVISLNIANAMLMLKSVSQTHQQILVVLIGDIKDPIALFAKSRGVSPRCLWSALFKL